ncbi:MFS drug transporter, putative [Talaromyces stipitatus ATCC 10500]|uniref:MFS drug transporter, putative n=1 Tax=Talaromyces stipitatus (strain ATCC 10500 / CBS 375.48 / QM 6759 / NRRL 1006) TaxID=441959 RepID=B8MTF8_TALSN|nr:MFS drug transporter, putative [Talaromyces stipitatus ATCC 10500]EED12290.1 MFS drug transporter, putative [Talaromyces stipitatus ATCC 10500]
MAIEESNSFVLSDSRTSDDIEQLSEFQTLLRQHEQAKWKPPKGFVWIQVAIFANVFLSGFDGTITVSTYALISSEFNAANTASWLTTSYLITSTAFQPIYGRMSDIFGRKPCFYVCTIAFLLGCLGCGVAQDMFLLNIMRAITGVGGGGLITMATIINSDLIPFKNRGMYQAAQNVLHGFGAICGASLGGAIAETIGWRWCFLLQVPLSVFALVVGKIVIRLPQTSEDHNSTHGWQGIWNQVDILGTMLLVSGLSVQLIGLSLGGNELPWSNPWIILSLTGSVALLALFLWTEARTLAAPIIPLRLLHGTVPICIQIANLCVGMGAYAFLFNLPLFFQVVLLDSASTAGARLVIPSLATPLGGLIAGIIMSRWGRLSQIVQTGALLMFVGNLLVAMLRFNDASWKYFVYVFPANLGQGMVYPGILFSFLAAFDHTDHAVSSSTVYLIRSLGNVWGVAITSAVVQNQLNSGLSKALSGIPDHRKVKPFIFRAT